MVIFISIKILICLITFIFLINKKFVHLKQFKVKLINGIMGADQMCLETQVQDDVSYIFNVSIFFHYNHLEH